MKTSLSGHLLLVDDDKCVRESIEMVVASQGIQVTSAANAPEALKLLSDKTFDFAIIDVEMLGTSGIELCRQIRALEQIKPFPILMLSGYTDAQTQARTRAAGADEFLAKPFSIQDIFSFFKKHQLHCNQNV
jgi:CheY-like chemotaxis protein